ncbi:MAG: CRISPR-associated CARF protein Csx1 [Deltaproteobacteria bacterium]|nr:CRISPR-associated CARF protein Csx1 [Deltaproteobacteria bacterium]
MSYTTFIFQIGRIDFNFLQSIKFKIGESSFTETLSSLALREYYENENVKNILIYPVSLVFSSHLLDNPKFRDFISKDFLNAFERAFTEPDAYLANPTEFFEKHPHSKEVDSFFVIHSLGTYSLRESTISFDCTYDDIVLEIFVYLIETYLNHVNYPTRYVIDISSGHNVYISALIEAVRQFGVFTELASWKDKSKKPTVAFAFSDPIIPGSDFTYNIHFEPLSVKTFFAAPIHSADFTQNSIVKSLSFGDKNLKKSLRGLIENFILTYSALKNSIPLYIYQFGYDDEGTIKQCLEEIIANLKKRFQENYRCSPKFQRDTLVRAFLVLAMYWGIIKTLIEIGVQKSNYNGIAIEDMKVAFDRVYDVFQLVPNKTLLGREVSDLTEVKLNKEELHSEFRPLYLFLDKGKTGSPDKRNFLAHSGLERNITMVKCIDNKIFIKYDEKHENIIKRWLINSL